jgi:hypothetical protein
MTPPTSRFTSRRTAVVLVAALVSISSPSFAIEPARLSGGITGLVRDGLGIPQMGATVLLFNRQDRLFARALSNEKGGFSFLSLVPDVYSVRVSLRSFVPVFRENIVVQPGVRSMLNVSLTTLFSSIELVTPPPGERALMSDDWKWVLRSASSTRPILRILPNAHPDPDQPARHATAVFSETRGMVQLSGGDGGAVSGFANEADLGTAFAFATSLFGGNQVAFSGNLGYLAQSGMASEGFRTSYTRQIRGASPVVTLTMRQLVLARGAEGLMGGPGESGLPPLRTMSVSLGDEAQLSDALRLQYGFSLDMVSFLDRLHYFSPYARLEYTLPDDAGKVSIAYTSGDARPELGGSPAALDSGLQNDINALSRLPRMSLRDGQGKVQRGQDLEAGYSRKIGSRLYSASGYSESVTNAALNIVAPGGFYAGGDISPDLFSNTSVFNAGNYQTFGYTLAVTQNLGDRYNVSVMYGSVGVLAPGSDELSTANLDELRSMIRAERRNAVTTRGSGTLAKTGTHFIASYQWMNDRSVTPGHIYSTDPMRPDPGLNLYVRQPIPTFFSLPWRMEATADLRNLLAQGYLPLSGPEGQHLLLVQTPRSFRGGLRFIF